MDHSHTFNLFRNKVPLNHTGDIPLKHTGDIPLKHTGDVPLNHSGNNQRSIGYANRNEYAVLILKVLVEDYDFRNHSLISNLHNIDISTVLKIIMPLFHISTYWDKHMELLQDKLSGYPAKRSFNDMIDEYRQLDLPNVLFSLINMMIISHTMCDSDKNININETLNLCQNSRPIRVFIGELNRLLESNSPAYNVCLLASIEFICTNLMDKLTEMYGLTTILAAYYKSNNKYDRFDSYLLIAVSQYVTNNEISHAVSSGYIMISSMLNDLLFDYQYSIKH